MYSDKICRQLRDFFEMSPDEYERFLSNPSYFIEGLKFVKEQSHKPTALECLAETAQEVKEKPNKKRDDKTALIILNIHLHILGGTTPDLEAAELAEETGYTPARIRQLQANAIKKIKESQIFDEYEDFSSWFEGDSRTWLN